MRRATVVAVFIVGLLGLAGFTIGGSIFESSSNDPIQVTWLSNTDRGVEGNHHPVAAGRTDNGVGLVFAPLSGGANSNDCALVTLYATNGTPRWDHQIPPSNCTIHSVADPTLARFGGNQTVLAATTTNELLGFDPETGVQTLAIPLERYGYTKPIVADITGDVRNEIVVVDVSGTVTFVRANGSVGWRLPLGSLTWGRPGLADADDDGDRDIIVGVGRGRVTGIDVNGSIVWEQTNAIEGQIIWMETATTASGEEMIVPATTAGVVARIDPGEDSYRWRHDLGDFAAVHAIGDGDGDGDTEIYPVANDGTLRAIDADSGEIEWERKLAKQAQAMAPPALAQLKGASSPSLFVPTHHGSVYRVDPTTGKVTWQYERPVSIFTHPTVASVDQADGETVFITYSDGRILAVQGAS